LPFDGPPADRPGPLSAEIGVWADLNGCDERARETAGPNGAASFQLDCPAPAGSVGYVLHDGGHVWPGALTPSDPFFGPAAPDLDGNALVLEFLGLGG